MVVGIVAVIAPTIGTEDDSDDDDDEASTFVGFDEYKLPRSLFDLMMVPLVVLFKRRSVVLY